MDAICVFLSSFRAAKGRTCHSWTPAGCEPWATDGISLCLYYTMPMLCLRASQLYKLKQTFSFIDSIWLIFLNLCVSVCVCLSVCLSACVRACVLCFAKPPLTTANKHGYRGSKSFKTHTFDFLANPSPPMVATKSHDALHHSWPHGHFHCCSYLWLPALPIFPSLYCPH